MGDQTGWEVGGRTVAPTAEAISKTKRIMCLPTASQSSASLSVSLSVSLLVKCIPWGEG